MSRFVVFGKMYLGCTVSIGGTLGFTTGVNETLVRSSKNCKTVDYLDQIGNIAKYTTIGSIVGPLSPIILPICCEISENIKPNH